MRHFFEFLNILNKTLIFLSVFITIIIISDLTINIRSTVLKKGVFRSVEIVYFKESTCQTGIGFIEVGCFAFLDSTVIRFDLEHHPLDVNL